MGIALSNSLVMLKKSHTHCQFYSLILHILELIEWEPDCSRELFCARAVESTSLCKTHHVYFGDWGVLSEFAPSLPKLHQLKSRAIAVLKNFGKDLWRVKSQNVYWYGRARASIAPNRSMLRFGVEVVGPALC